MNTISTCVVIKSTGTAAVMVVAYRFAKRYDEEVHITYATDMLRVGCRLLVAVDFRIIHEVE